MDIICPLMKGEKCAEIYCDYWDEENQMCSQALLTKRKIELIEKIDKWVEKLKLIKNKDRIIEEFISKMGIMEVSLNKH